MTAYGRIVVPETPHHITQRGNHGMQVFLQESDYATYLTLLRESCEEAKTTVLAWCLMPNHVHLIMTPRNEEGLRRALAEPQRIYARMINERMNWKGHLWQERYASFPMDEEHLIAALRYVELNPVRAGLTGSPEQWQWSSARGHLSGQGDSLVRDLSLLQLIDDWRGFLASGVDEQSERRFQQHVVSSKPLGDGDFITRIENITGRRLHPQKRGPKPK